MRSILMLAVAAALICGTAAMAQTGWKEYKWDGQVPIEDASGNPARVEIDVPPDPVAPIIGELQVDMIIQHSWQGDLVVELWHKTTGTRQVLINRIGTGTFGYSADNFGNPITGDKLFIVEGANSIQNSGGISNLTGQWGPGGGQPGGGTHGSLDAFVGERKDGLWSLLVSDHAGGDTGWIRNFSLHIFNVPEPASLALLGLGAVAALRRRR